MRSSRRWRQRLGRLDLGHPGEQQQVDDDRPELDEHHLRRHLVGRAPPGPMPRRPRAAARARPTPAGRPSSSSATMSVASARSWASSDVGLRDRSAVVGGHRGLAHQDPGAAQRAVHRLDQVGHPPDVGAVPHPERRRRHHRHPLVGRRLQLADQAVRRRGRRPGAPGRARPRRRPSPRRPRAAAPRSCGSPPPPVRAAVAAAPPGPRSPRPAPPHRRSPRRSPGRGPRPAPAPAR